MKLFASLVLTVLAINASAKECTPPVNPDVKAIRDEAKADANAGRYESALQKYVWWHENVNKYQPSMSAVRLSFGLSDWYQLGEVYPPALAKLKETRERRQRIVSSPKSLHEFLSTTFMNSPQSIANWEKITRL